MIDPSLKRHGKRDLGMISAVLFSSPFSDFWSVPSGKIIIISALNSISGTRLKLLLKFHIKKSSIKLCEPVKDKSNTEPGCFKHLRTT